MNADAAWDRVQQFLAASVKEDPSLGPAVHHLEGRLAQERRSGKLPPQRCWLEDDSTLTLEWIWGEDRRVINVASHTVTDAEFKAGELARHSRQHISAESASGR